MALTSHHKRPRLLIPLRDKSPLLDLRTVLNEDLITLYRANGVRRCLGRCFSLLASVAHGIGTRLGTWGYVFRRSEKLER